MLDLLVVGAGPAGVAAALTAQARGLDVALVDKASFPRDKTCGDGLTTGALRLLEQLGVEVPTLDRYATVRETVLVSPSGRRVVLPLPGDGEHSAVVPRLDLDAALVARARDAGAPVREAATLTGLTVDDNGARAVFDDGPDVEARFVVASDGHWSAVRRLLEPAATPDLGTWHAFRQYFASVSSSNDLGPNGAGDDAGARQWVVFDADLLPGYAWVFPLPGGRANVGFGVLRAPGVTGKSLKQLWVTLRDRPAMRAALGPNAVAEDSQRAWPIPASFDPARLVDGRVLYTGDAAHVVDPMTGEGIAQALESGILAATEVARGGDPRSVGERYRERVDRALGRDLRFAGLLQRALRSPLGARAAIRAAGLTPWTRRNFARWMFEDYPRALVITPDRWRRGMFTPPGAYR
jgi:geranylgeranyl reductase family protein